MKTDRSIYGAIVGAAFIAIATTQGMVGQIYNQFTLSIKPKIYSPLAGQGVAITRSEFLDPITSAVDANNGVAGPLSLPFPFEYNNQVYTQIYVCVNGWIGFQNPGTNITADPLSLYTNLPPNLTVAPYFGDHYFRAQGFDNQDPAGQPYTPSLIRYLAVPASGGIPAQFIVEWGDMNINYRFDANDPDNPFAANQQPQAQSVGTFQVYLIQADPNDPSQPCRIEFHYGAIGSASATGVIKTSGASVGIEDEPAISGGPTTFINADAFRASGSDINTAIQSTNLTTVWPPTGFPARAFVFQCQSTSAVPEPVDVVAEVRSYPRPARDQIAVDGALIAGSQMTLRNITGSTVVNATATGSGHEQLNVAGVASGVYLLELETRSGSVRERVIIVR